MAVTTSGPHGGETPVLRLVQRLQDAVRQGDRAVTVDMMRQLVELRAPMGNQWAALAQVAAGNGETGLARAAIDLFVEAVGGDPAALLRKAGLLIFLGAWQEADAVFRALPAAYPDPASHAYNRGSAALYLGRADEARDFFEQAIRANPLAGSPWLSLSLMVDFAREPELADRILAAQRTMDGAVQAERANYCYALGKAHADLGEHARAFDAYARGGMLMKAQFRYSRDQDREGAADAVRGYDAGNMAALAAGQAEPTGRTIFVTGMPRSGTTLVEQILASHSAVGDGGEIYLSMLLAREVGGASFPALKDYVDAGQAPEAARLWQHWLHERFPGPGRVVDKTLNTSRLMGLAAGLLPEAPLVWLTRDPLDCTWSCFRTRFSNEGPWSNDLEDLAFHLRLEDELLARWRDILGERLLVVPFEQLVSDPEQWIRTILRHCGLAEEPQVFAPHENKRMVTTSSVMQVRKPINLSGIGVAEPYREFLEPFVRAYYA